MKKISFILVLALGLMACEKMESGPVIEREDSNSLTEMADEVIIENPGELTMSAPGNDAINYPEIPGKGDPKGEGTGNN